MVLLTSDGNYRHVPLPRLNSGATRALSMTRKGASSSLSSQLTISNPALGQSSSLARSFLVGAAPLGLSGVPPGYG